MNIQIHLPDGTAGTAEVHGLLNGQVNYLACSAVLDGQKLLFLVHRTQNEEIQILTDYSENPDLCQYTDRFTVRYEDMLVASWHCFKNKLRVP